jgi:hypothetical protein
LSREGDADDEAAIGISRTRACRCGGSGESRSRVEQEAYDEGKRECAELQREDPTVTDAFPNYDGQTREDYISVIEFGGLYGGSAQNDWPLRSEGYYGWRDGCVDGLDWP